MPLEPERPDGQVPPPGSGDEQDSECGITNPVACVTEGIHNFFRGIVTGALNPLLELLGQTLLTTPQPSALPGVRQLWTQSWEILVAAYVLIVLVAGLLIMGYETLQTRYSVKEIAPRIGVGFLAGTLSLFVATKAIQLANALSSAVLGDGVNPEIASRMLTDLVLGSLDGALWVIFIGLALAVMIVVLLVTFLVRVMLTVLLVAAAPLALMWHALPHTEGLAHAWWKAFGGVLGIQVAQSLTLVVALRVFFAPGGYSSFGSMPSSGLMNMLLCLALMWVLIKIPFWFLSPLRGGKRSLVGSLARGVIAYKTMGLLGGMGNTLRNRGARRGGSRTRAGNAASSDPPATRSGQYLLPLRVRRTRTPARHTQRLGDLPTPTARADSRRPGAGQLSLFTAHGSGAERTVRANPRALPPESVPHALPKDQLMLPVAAARDPGRLGRRSLADDLAEQRPAHPPTPQSGLLTPDGRINRNARPLRRQPRTWIPPEAGMLPLHLRAAPPRPPRPALADDLADVARPPTPSQKGPGLITSSGQINRAARAPRRRTRDAYTGNRPLASGQYPLPLNLRRQPKPTSSPPATPQQPPRRETTGTQPPLPLNLPGRRDRTK